MKQDQFKIGALHNTHVKNEFSCGIDALDHYISKQAKQDAKRNLAITYTLTEKNNNLVLGYYTLSSTSINLNSLPDNITKKLPRHPSVPATLIGRLAIHNDQQGNKLGERLLIDALKRSLDISQNVSSMAVIVEAKENAISFYKKYGFIEFKDEKSKLFLPMKTIQLLF